MNEIRTTKIDGQEFVTLTDYLNVKEENKAVGIVNDELRRINENLREEIKKLNIIIENTKIEQKSDREHVDELEEENKDLDKQIEQFKKGVKAGTNIIERLEGENKKLKEKLEQIKETYIRFEDSEKEYNKGLGELDQLIMNR